MWNPYNIILFYIILLFDIFDKVNVFALHKEDFD